MTHNICQPDTNNILVYRKYILYMVFFASLLLLVGFKVSGLNSDVYWVRLCFFLVNPCMCVDQIPLG
jgi:hypothetical protein